MLLCELIFRILAHKDDDRRTGKALFAGIAATSGIACLLRSNGIAVVGLTGLTVLVFALVQCCRRTSNWKASLYGGTTLLTVALLCLVITGPVYSALGVQKASNAEALGVPLNQMARVAALEGTMSDSDKAYMSALLPNESYATAYHPMCTDQLKWNPGFHDELLNNGFWNHWISMFVHNPVMYFEAWELQTCGFWMPNIPWTFDAWNIGGGVPCNISDIYLEQANSYGVYPRNLFGTGEARELFPPDGPSIPVAWVLWLVLFELLCFLLLRQRIWLLVLVPSLGLMLSILLATPIFYWPRYAAVLQLLVPAYIALLAFAMARARNVRQDDAS